MKKTLILIGALLTLITESQAQIRPKVTCPPVAVVERAIRTLDLEDVKNQLSRKINLANVVIPNTRRHIFSLETQPINRMRGPIGNNCYYYTPDCNNPVYTIRLF